MKQSAESILREYMQFYDVNQSETIEVLPLTIIDAMEEYENQQERSYSEEEVLNKLTHFAVEIQRQNKQGIYPLRIIQWFDRNKKK